MRRFSGANIGPGAFRAPKVTLGTFDGVHLGHQQVLRQLLAWARSKDADAVVVTFDQKPRRVLDGVNAGPILSLDHRLLILERLGIDAVVVLHFDEAFAALEPEDFVRDTLLNGIGARGVLLGHDTRFGRGGRGDDKLMKKLGDELGFEVCSVPVVELDGQPISSSRIRNAVRAGKLDLAERMLGRPVSVFGTVVHGTARGRDFGWPTANLDLHHEVRPPEGVYVTQTWLDGLWRDSITNIGRPPTLARAGAEHLSKNTVVETHVFDYRGDLYGKDLEIRFLDRIRPEQVFRSREELIRRIDEDVRLARERLAREKS